MARAFRNPQINPVFLIDQCKSCTGRNGRCNLHCPTVNLPANWGSLTLDQKYGSERHNPVGKPKDSVLI